MDTGWRNHGSHEVQREVQSSVPGKEQFCTELCVGNQLESSMAKRAGGPNAQLVQHEPGNPCCKEGKWYPGLHRTPREGDPAPLFSTGEATLVVLCPVLGFSIQETQAYRRDFSKGTQGWLRAWESWDRCSEGKRRLRRNLINLCKYLKGGCNLCEYLKEGYFQWFPVAQTRGINWNAEWAVWMSRNIVLLKGWWRTGNRLLRKATFYPWRYYKCSPRQLALGHPILSGVLD